MLVIFWFLNIWNIQPIRATSRSIPMMTRPHSAENYSSTGTTFNSYSFINVMNGKYNQNHMQTHVVSFRTSDWKYRKNAKRWCITCVCIFFSLPTIKKHKVCILIKCVTCLLAMALFIVQNNVILSLCPLWHHTELLIPAFCQWVVLHVNFTGFMGWVYFYNLWISNTYDFLFNIY